MKTLFSNAVMQIMAAFSVISTVGCLCVSKTSKRYEEDNLPQTNCKQEEIDFFQY